MKNTFLRKILSIVLAAVFLSAFLTVLVFRMTAIGAYSEIQLDELRPRAAFLANRSQQYLLGTISYREYQSVVVENNSIWGATPYIFTADGTLFVYPPNTESEEGMRHLMFVEHYLPDVLSGKSVSISSRFAADTLIGEPVYGLGGSVIGAVFLFKPLQELRAALQTLWVSLLVACICVAIVMLLPAYFVSRRVANPLRQMNQVALAMAHGNFSVRADVNGTDEIAQLGSSINYLASALSRTISDLVFERNRLRTTLDGLGEGVITLDPCGAVLQHNRAAIDLLNGNDKTSIEQLPLFAKSIHPAAKEALASGRELLLEEKINNKMIRVTLSLLTDSSGAVAGGILLVCDITESTRLEQTRRDYVANVSHELRTPLASIRGLSDALSDGLVKKEEDRIRYYGYIQKESIRLSRLIDDLLELSRLQSGTIAFEKRKTDIADIVCDVAERFHIVSEESGNSLSLTVAEDIPAVYGNPDRIEQVLIVLLDNAFKHASGNTEVAVLVEEHMGKVHVSVSNEGSIDPIDIPHVFERFYKADKSHSGNGTGLGLSIASEIMKLMGESIFVESREGVVRFTFTLTPYSAENSKPV